MAEGQGPGGAPRRKRSMKPKPGTLELEATEIEREPAPQADEPPPAAEADPLDAEPRSQLGALIGAGVAGAAIAIFAFILLLVGGFIPVGAGDAALGSRIADIEMRMGELDRAPPPAPPPVEDGALRADLDRLAAEVAHLRETPPQVVPDTALQARVDLLAARLDEVTKAAQGGPGSETLDRLSKRIDELAAKAAAPPAPDPAVQQALAGSKSAATLAAVAALESALARGAPYAAALGAVRRQLPDASYAALEEDAEHGMAAPALLAARLAAQLEKAPASPSNAQGFVDRLVEGTRGLVRIKPVDGAVPEISADDPWSARNAVAIRLEQGDYAGALADWEKLDAAAKEATRAAMEALQKRMDANSALDALRGAALGAEQTP